jgi:hypothetical protein
MVVDSTMAVLTTASQLAKFTAGNQFWQLVMADEFGNWLWPMRRR